MPLHLRANGIFENSMRNINKSLRITNMQKTNWKLALYNYSMAYRKSSNMSTKVPPALLLNNKIPRTNIPTANHKIDKPAHQKLEAHDKVMKDKMKKYSDNEYRTKTHQIHIGDHVLVKQPRSDKRTPPFNLDPYFVKCAKGRMVTVERRNKL